MQINQIFYSNQNLIQFINDTSDGIQWSSKYQKNKILSKIAKPKIKIWNESKNKIKIPNTKYDIIKSKCNK